MTDVAGARRGGATVAACTDGDATCDADGTADGRCTFAVRLCLNVALPNCPGGDAVMEAALQNPTAGLTGLVAALSAMPMPDAAPESCTDTVAVPVATGRLVVRGTAVMASGHADHDRLVLSCRRAAPVATATFATIQRQVFARSCASFSCHGAAAAGGLSLVPDAAYGNLVGVAPANDTARGAGLLRVAPGDPAQSYILLKLAGPLAVGEGDPMPRVGSALPAPRVDLLRRWIAAGAPATGRF